MQPQIVSSNELMHYGVLGMRWGIRRYQPYSVKPRASGEGGKEIGAAKKGYFARRKEAKQEKLKVKTRNENLAKAREALATKKQHAANKERVLKEGTATEILEYLPELTNQELSNALNRVKWTKELRELSVKEKEANWTKMDKAMKKVKDVNTWTNTGLDSVNTINRLVKLLENASTTTDEKDKKK